MTRGLLVSLAGAILFVAATAFAKPPQLAPSSGPTACGYKSFPLAAGNTWTYKSAMSQVVLKVTKVGPGKDWQGKPATVADLEETYQGRTLNTQISCTPAGGIIVPVESFFFSGEPGG